MPDGSVHDSERRLDAYLDGLIEDAIVGFRVGLRIANADEMPTWNEGDEFEAARLEALGK